MAQNVPPYANGRTTTFDGTRLSKLLLVSAGAYLLVHVLHLIGRSTQAYHDNLISAADRVFGDGSTTVEINPGVGLWSIVGPLAVLALYALIYIYVRKGQNWARVTGIVLACLGAASSLMGFFDAFFYGLYGIVVALAIVAFVAVNVVWIVAAIRGR